MKEILNECPLDSSKYEVAWMGKYLWTTIIIDHISSCWYDKAKKSKHTQPKILREQYLLVPNAFKSNFLGLLENFRDLYE